MTNNAAAEVEPEISPGTRVILLEDCQGTIENDMGKRVQTTALKNEIVTIYKSNQDAPKLKPRTSSNLMPDEYVQTPREYSVKATRGTWTPYAITTSSNPKGVNNEQLIPHGSLGPYFDEKPEIDAKGFYAPGNRMLVTKPVMCKNSKAPGGKLTIGIGARVSLRSGGRTQKGSDPKNKSEVFYCFQVLLPEEPRNKEFRSGDWLLPGKHFQVLDN